MAFAVGIDLGTTNTVVAVVRDGVASTIPDPLGRRLIPSVVSFLPSGSVVVGEGALERRLVDAPNTIYSVKRLIGRAWSSAEVQQSRSRLPFELREGPHAGTVVAARGETYSLPEVSAFVLRQAKAVAEAALGAPVERAVITVPANFNDLQRAATKTAGRLAGLDVLRILNEPTAAALAYGPQEKTQERIAVYDLGGGTFDVTILDLAGNVFEVLATAGDTTLGGDDIDDVVAERMADELLTTQRIDARTQPLAFGRLRLFAEQMKRSLSSRNEHEIVCDGLAPTARPAAPSWTFRMTRPELEWAALPLVERTFRVCQHALEMAGLTPADLDRIITVGGATRMPMVPRKVEQFFGRAPAVRINPDEVVALGAAIQATLLDRARQRSPEPMVHPRIAEESVVQRLPEPDSNESAETFGLPLIVASKPEPPPDRSVAQAAPPKPAPLPVPAVRGTPRAPPPANDTRARDAGPRLIGIVDDEPAFLPGRAAAELVFDVPGARARARPARTPLPTAPALDPRTFVEPPQAAAPPVVDRPPPLLIDVTPLGLGVETVAGFCDILIDANTPVPCDRTRTFATASAGQTTVTVRVAQGGSKRFAENTFLGELELTGIAASGRGESQVAVTFEIDADGILNVRARDVKTGRETAARIQLVGAQAEPRAMQEMQARQAAHPLAALEGPS